jgi:alanyl-tRNA synthetase
LGEHVSQKGSHITSERLRFDFSHPQRLTEDEIKNVEDLMNEQIKKDLPVSFETKSLTEAIAEGALHFFAEKYGKEVKVYTIGPTSHEASRGAPFSREICGGPHVGHTNEIGGVNIIKQEKIGSGIVRIYVALSK